MAGRDDLVVVEDHETTGERLYLPNATDQLEVSPSVNVVLTNDGVSPFR
jgi:hypothetical protein